MNKRLRFHVALWILISCLAAVQTGVGEFVEGQLSASAEHDDGCEHSCPGDAPDGSCPPLCDDCVCCPALAPVVIPTAIATGCRSSEPAYFVDSQRQLPGVDHQIFRPPRPASAVC